MHIYSYFCMSLCPRTYIYIYAHLYTHGQLEVRTARAMCAEAHKSVCVQIAAPVSQGFWTVLE